ncbi:hypothetical protein Q8A73_010872 [Channa argus]|nr:hypothetical protein Q8A73_010872 [Channa argus]
MSLSEMSRKNLNLIIIQKPISGVAWLLQTAGASVVHRYPAIQLHRSASISPTQCGFKRSGALKSVVGSSFRHDVSRRESESRGESECSLAAKHCAWVRGNSALLVKNYSCHRPSPQGLPTCPRSLLPPVEGLSITLLCKVIHGRPAPLHSVPPKRET